MDKVNLLPYYRIETEVFARLSRFEQRRKHRRPRINKKWRKRYGFISENFAIPIEFYEPKRFKRYNKVFEVQGRATPSTNRLQIPFMPQMSIFDKPTESVSYEVKRIDLLKFGYTTQSQTVEAVKSLLVRTRYALECKVAEFSNTFNQSKITT